MITIDRITNFLISIFLLLSIGCEKSPIDTDDTGPIDTILLKAFAYYPFDGNSKDKTGNGHEAIVSGGTLTIDRFGHQDHAYSFNGTSANYISCNNFSDFPSGKPVRSISGWFRSSAVNTVKMALFGMGSMSEGYNFLLTVGPGSSGTQFRVNGWTDSYDWRTEVKALEMIDGKWHHCAVTYDSVVTRIYFDGVLRNQTSSFTYRTNPATMKMVIGNEIDLNGWAWQGEIDDVSIYAVVLTDDEIKKLASDK